MKHAVLIMITFYVVREVKLSTCLVCACLVHFEPWEEKHLKIKGQVCYLIRV